MEPTGAKYSKDEVEAAVMLALMPHLGGGYYPGAAGIAQGPSEVLDILHKKEKEIREAVALEVAGSRYESYQYNEQMARHVTRSKEDRTDDERAKNNEASRQSRFNKSRREFIEGRVTNKFMELAESLNVAIQAERNLRKLLTDRLVEMGMNQAVLQNAWSNMLLEWEQAEQVVSSTSLDSSTNAKQQSAKKRRRDELE